MTSIGIVMNGVTGRMGYRQHLVRSILAIREQGGVPLADGAGSGPSRCWSAATRTSWRSSPAARPRPTGPPTWTRRSPTTDGRSTSTPRSPGPRRGDPQGHRRRQAHLHREADRRDLRGGARAGPAGRRRRASSTAWCRTSSSCRACCKLKRLIDGGFFGRILSVRGEFGYWVFEGDWQPAQRPSWNYRAEDGGGIVARHVPALALRAGGPVRPGRVRVPRRPPPTSRSGSTSRAGPTRPPPTTPRTRIFELEGGIIAQINSSWAVRVNRDELVEFQVDGTHGSAVAGLRGCRIQPRMRHPSRSGTPTSPTTARFRAQWHEVPDNEVFDNGFKAQWEEFLRHVVEDAPYPCDFLAGARGVQLAELGLRSSREGRRIQLAGVGL